MLIHAWSLKYRVKKSRNISEILTSQKPLVLVIRIGPRLLKLATHYIAKKLNIRVHLSRDMRFPTMWCVGPAKAQTSLCIRAV